MAVWTNFEAMFIYIMFCWPNRSCLADFAATNSATCSAIAIAVATHRCLSAVFTAAAVEEVAMRKLQLEEVPLPP